MRNGAHQVKRLALLAGFLAALVLGAAAATDDGSFELDPETVARSFQPFVDHVAVRWDDEFVYVESDSMPEHRMMVGVRAWNQQVPIPQPYTGGNSFRLPLRPRIAETPVSGKETLFRGAIAVAANGVPIFNPIKQDGRTDTNLAGELDEFGGHAGRADDYHYHLAPVHLQERVGERLPVAWALDGFPIYGYREADGSDAEGLDWLNGHSAADGSYHYHATDAYPYLNGGFRGVVELRNGEVAVQPRARGVRPYTRPLRGATITGFVTQSEGNYELEYRLSERMHSIAYTVAEDRSTKFVFTDGNGRQHTETYEPRIRRGDRTRPPTEPRGPAGRRGDGRRRGGRAASGGADGNRQPWLAAHAEELDTNGDGSLRLDELMAVVDETFAGFDRDGNGELSQAEYSSPGVRTAFAGFVGQHASEIDRDGDQKLSPGEVSAIAQRMFGKEDRDGDGTLDPSELARRAAR